MCILSWFTFHPFFLVEAIEDMDDGFRLKVLRTMEEKKTSWMNCFHGWFHVCFHPASSCFHGWFHDCFIPTEKKHDHSKRGRVEIFRGIPSS